MQNQSLFSHTNGWDSQTQSLNNIILGISIVAFILHCNIWLQLFIQKTKFNLSFMLILSYSSTDILIVIYYLIAYSICIRSWITITPIFCYSEAYLIFFLNLFESFCLTTLNIARYWQIVHNQDVYKFHRRKIQLIPIFITCLILLNFSVQHLFGWCIVTKDVDSSCSLHYTNIFVQIWNIAVILAMPIIISLFLSYRSFFYIRAAYVEQTMVRRNHHRKLIVHTSIFYSIWFCLWFPFVLITFLNVNRVNYWVVFMATIANTLEIAIDPIILLFLDTRFLEIWKKFFRLITIRLTLPINVQIRPIV